MKYIVDRIEGNMVVCENQETKKMENLPKSMFPENIKEGSVIEKEGETIILKPKDLKDITEEVNRLFSKLFKKDDKE